jgi:hypothetical protein
LIMSKRLMRRQPYFRRNHPESGQTILLVALAIVSLLGMAALAIDVVTLYVARTEIQRAADAAALAGAKAVADSGYTTLPAGDPNFGTAQTLANTMADKAIHAVFGTNPVAGAAPTLTSFAVDLTTSQGDARITVTLTRSGLPTFFSKIFGRSNATVVATAVAEAYNPSNNSTFTPVAPRSLKPWLVANVDPIQNTPFINTTTGAVGPPNTVVGEQFDLTSDCNSVVACTSLVDPTPGRRSVNQVDYVPLQVAANPKNVCTLSCLGATPYENSIECADVNPYVAPSCGGNVPNATWDNTVNPSGLTGLSAVGAECLIHASSFGNAGQDTLDKSAWPGAPMKITAHSGLQSGNLVTTSNSIVTIPIIDQTTFSSAASPVTVVGYMQAFINDVEGTLSSTTTPGDINITVLNISACSTTPNGAPPVVGGAGTSPVPVRLITPP